jgi:hypothetical protein
MPRRGPTKWGVIRARNAKHAREILLYKERVEKAAGVNGNQRMTFLQQNISRAGNRPELTHDITINQWYLEELYQKQRGRCALTGVKLEFTRGGEYWGGKWCNPRSCTIDRIDSSKGYEFGNVQLVICEVNVVKRDLPDGDFKALCAKVTAHQKRLKRRVSKKKHLGML